MHLYYFNKLVMYSTFTKIIDRLHEVEQKKALTQSVKNFAKPRVRKGFWKDNSRFSFSLILFIFYVETFIAAFKSDLNKWKQRKNRNMNKYNVDKMTKVNSFLVTDSL